MHEREIHLVEHFTGETVIIEADGRQLARCEGVKTDLRKGYAKIMRVMLPDATTVVGVEVPEKKVEAAVTVEPARLRYLKVLLHNGVLTVDPVDEEEHQRAPRGYG
jgi:hypothetical protein